MACLKLYVKYDMEIVSMAFLNIVLLFSFPYFDVRVLTIALYLCAYMLHLEAQLICHILSLKLYYFFFDFFFLNSQRILCFRADFLLLWVCTNINKSIQVQCTGEGVLFL